MGIWLGNKMLILDWKVALAMVLPLMILIPLQCRSISKNIRLERLCIFTLFISATSLIYTGLETYIERTVPEVTVIVHNPKGYSNYKEYGWQNGKDMSINRDYLNNLTADTLFRVLVSYAIPGENPDNVYYVTDTIPPFTFKRMKGAPDYCMRRIPPLKKWESDRWGTHRKRVAFIVNRRQFDFFQGYDLKPIGLGPNRRVEFIEEPYHSLWQDTVMFSSFERRIENFLLRHAR